MDNSYPSFYTCVGTNTCHFHSQPIEQTCFAVLLQYVQLYICLYLLYSATDVCLKYEHIGFTSS